MATKLTLGRGELWFAQYLPGTLTPGGERYLGNSPEFSATLATTNLDHTDSDHGINEKDFSIPLTIDRTGNFTTDNIDPKNVAIFFFGTSNIFTVAGGAVAAEPHVNIQLGTSYQLGMSNSNPSGARALSSTTLPVVTDFTTPATMYVAGTDYTIDLELGRFTPLEDGAIPEGGGVNIAYTTTASSRTRIISGSTAISGALRYIAYNPAGEQLDWYMPYVKLTPNGDYALKGDTFQTIPFNLEILKKSPMEAIYIDGRPYVE